MPINHSLINKLENKAREIRISIVEMLFHAKSGHTAGALGMVEIFTYLFFEGIKHNSQKTDWTDRDRLVLSNGHICPVFYATLAEANYFEKKELMNLRKIGSILQGHPDRNFFKFTETSSGPLGSGLSQAVGMAIGIRMKRENMEIRHDTKVICIISDAELNEGNTWEALMLANKERLDNLIVIIDRNKIQISGNTEDVMPLEPVQNKLRDFGFETAIIDGNSFYDIDQAWHWAKSSKKPFCILANTVPGKGVSIFENNYKWHGKTPNEEERRIAIQELNKVK